MKRVGAFLLSLALLVQFASGARLFDSHEEWTRTCKNDSHHLCSDVNTHDQDRCAICVITATGPDNFSIGAPEIGQVAQAFVAPPPPVQIIHRDWDATGSRGPPLLGL